MSEPKDAPQGAQQAGQDAVLLTVRLELAYRGTAFRGFAANAGVRTVAGELSDALERIIGDAPTLVVAGRTDAGVHATGQVVSFQIGNEALRRVRGDGAEDQTGNRSGNQLNRLASALNRMLGPEIAVTAATLAADGFDARRSAVARAYEYRVRNAAVPDPRFADLEWHLQRPLNLGRMNEAARRFVGEHDFTSFCRRPKDRPDASLMRTVVRAQWTAQDPRRVGSRADSTGLLFEIEANAFCHQMVRAIVGHCVAVGSGDRSAEDVPAVLAARDRHAAAPVAPPHGLTLVAVRYPTAEDYAENPTERSTGALP